ncbi:MAG: glycosyl transferase family protein [Pseudomonadota bacterium]
MVEKFQPIIELVALKSYSIVFAAIVLIIFISSMDDLCLDVFFLIRRMYRRFFIQRFITRASGESLANLDKPQQAFAICVPAWDEGAVIGQMLARAVQDIRYDNYRIFVGVYQNDAETRAVIEALFKANPVCRQRVVIVDHPRNGPTTKADCLNTIYAHLNRAGAWPHEDGLAGFILHDAEDVIHPRELVVFNHLIEKADVIQLPVLPLVRPFWDLIGGHYQDEFAESHTKDMVMREALRSGMPSAGVGCAFSKRALQSLASKRGGIPFDTSSITEDYDLALDICAQGFRPMFVRLPSAAGSKSYVATHEYFPNTFSAAVKQKSRWLFGIALDSWNRRGWQGPFVTRYMFWRDRKSIVTSITAAAAYAVLLVFLIAALIQNTAFSNQLAAIAPPGGIVAMVLWINLGFLVVRVLSRCLFVYRYYGLWHALISPLRIVMGNVINFCAAYRATKLYYATQISGVQTAWSKTQHQFPTRDAKVSDPGDR